MMESISSLGDWPLSLFDDGQLFLTLSLGSVLFSFFQKWFEGKIDLNLFYTSGKLVLQ